MACLAHAFVGSDGNIRHRKSKASDEVDCHDDESQKVGRERYLPPTRKRKPFGTFMGWPYKRLMVVAFALAAFKTNPGWDEEGFRQFARSQRLVPFAHGIAQSMGLIDIKVLNLIFATVAWEGDRSFVGALSHWVEVPIPSKLQGFAVKFSDRAVQMANADVQDMDALRYMMLAMCALWQIFPKVAERHLVFSFPALRAGRIWTFLTAQLSHARLQHLLVNLMTLSYLGPTAHEVLGRSRFVAVYFVGGGCGIFASAMLQQIGGGAAECLGASSSLFALSGYLAGQGHGGLHWLEQDWSWAAFCVVQVLFVSALGAYERVDVAGHCVGAGVGFALGSLGV